MLIQIVDKAFLIYFIMLLVRILGSWLPELQGTRFMQFIAFYTDPYLSVFRRFIPPMGMFDISPIVAFICLNFLETATKSIIISLMS